MPDLSPSLDLLRRLGLNVPDAGPTPSNEQIQINDMLARASQSNDPNWKKNARVGVGALAGFTKGLVGTDPSEQTKQRILNGTANPDEKAEWYAAGAGQIGGQLSDAGLPFLAVNKGKPVFHGAPKVFEKFDPKRYDQNDVLGWMTHFAEDPTYAESYAMGNMKHSGKANAPNMIAAHPQAENTLDLVNPNIDDIAQTIASFSKNDPRRTRLIEDFKLARRNPESYRENISQTHYPDRSEIPANEIPLFYLSENLRLNPGELEKTPFDAIRYNDMNHKSWAIPETTPINTPWGAPLTNNPKSLTVTRLPDDAPIKSELTLDPNKWQHTPLSLPDTPEPEKYKLNPKLEFPIQKPKSPITPYPGFGYDKNKSISGDKIWSPKSNEDQWGVPHDQQLKPVKTNDDYHPLQMDEMIKEAESLGIDYNKAKDYPNLEKMINDTKLAGKPWYGNIEQKPWEGTPAYNLGNIEDNSLDKLFEDFHNETLTKYPPKDTSDLYDEPTANHKEFGTLSKSEASALVNGGELSMNWYMKNFSDK